MMDRVQSSKGRLLRRLGTSLVAVTTLLVGMLAAAPVANAAETISVSPQSVSPGSGANFTVAVTDANVWNAAYYINFNGWSGLSSCSGVTLILPAGSTATCAVMSTTRLRVLFTGGPVGVRNTFSVSIFPSSGLVAPNSPGTGTLSLEDFNGAYIATTSLCVGPCPWTITETFPPQPPQNVRAVKEFDATVGSDVIRVSWDAPADQGTLPVTHYLVTGGTDWGSPQTRFQASCLTDSAAKSLTSCVVTTPQSGYEPVLGPNMFSVKAFNGLGWSGASPNSNMVLIERDATPASAPLDPVAVAGWNSTTVNWQPPLSLGGGGTISNYLVISRPGSKICITRVGGPAADLNPLSCTFTSLRPGIQYRFEVQALNSNGWSPRSTLSNQASPYNLQLTSSQRVKEGFLRGGDSDVTVRGKAPGYAPGTRLNIWYRVGLNGTWVQDSRAKITVTAGGTFRWEREFPRRDNGKPISVRVSIAPVTADEQPATNPAAATASGVQGWSNTVVLEPVR